MASLIGGRTSVEEAKKVSTEVLGVQGEKCVYVYWAHSSRCLETAVVGNRTLCSFSQNILSSARGILDVSSRIARMPVCGARTACPFVKVYKGSGVSKECARARVRVYVCMRGDVRQGVAR